MGYQSIPGRSATLQGITVASSGLIDGETASYWGTKAFWAIDPTSGSDSALGWGTSIAQAETRPMKTFARLWDRLAGQRLGDIVVRLMGSPDFYADNLVPHPSITMVQTGNNRGGGIQIVGKETVVASGTLTGVRKWTDNTNRGKYILVAAGFNFTAYAPNGYPGPYYIRKVGGGCQAPIVTVQSATEISVAQPCSADPAAFFNNGGEANFVNGDAFEIISRPVIGNFGANNCRVSLSQVHVNADGYRNLVSSSGTTQVEFKYCSFVPKVYHQGNLYLTSCLLLDHFTVQHGAVGGIYNAILGNCAGAGITHNVQFNMFNGYCGLSDTTLQSGGAVDARNQSNFRLHGITNIQDFVADGTAPMVFGSDESGRMLFDPGPANVRGSNVAGYLFLSETPNFGGFHGVGGSTFNVEMIAPYDTNAIMLALEVGTPQVFPYSAIAATSATPIGDGLIGAGKLWYGFQ